MLALVLALESGNGNDTDTANGGKDWRLILVLVLEHEMVHGDNGTDRLQGQCQGRLPIKEDTKGDAKVLPPIRHDSARQQSDSQMFQERSSTLSRYWISEGLTSILRPWQNVTA